MSSAIAIEARNVSKRFGAVLANDDISLAVDKGTVHGIVGENGAGKSTLLKILFGFYQPTSGSVAVAGQEKKLASPQDAMNAGVAMVHQHFMLVEPFTVIENIILGAEGGALLKTGKRDAEQRLEELQEQFDLGLSLDATVADLSVGQRQRVEILKALFRGADVLILDEPTAVLTPQECEQLFALIERLKADGKTILFVTHKLNEIIATTDAVTVIRAGRVVGSHQTSETSSTELAEEMVGSKVTRAVSASDNAASEVILSLKGASATDDRGLPALKEITFDVAAGEIVGIAGVAGNGQTELLETIAGLRQLTSGEIGLLGQDVHTAAHRTQPTDMRKLGLAHIAEDRLKSAVVSAMSAEDNAVLGYQYHPDFNARGMMNRSAIQSKASEYFETQDVRPRDPSLPVSAFSGGNQQKLVIAREIARDPKVLIVGQPTRGVDIGAVTKIHDQLTELRNQGKAVMVVSADLDELFAISDRIIVMCEGVVTGMVKASEADEKTIGLMMAGAQAEQGEVA